MKKFMVSMLSTFAAVAAYAYSLPSVSTTSTQPGVWTCNIRGVRDAARSTGYPILVVVINDTNDGQGCTHCWAFLKNNDAALRTLATKYKYYMVLLNYMQGANGYSTLASTYRKDFGSYPILPSVYIMNPSGTVAKGWGYPLTDTAMTDRIQAVLETFVVRYSTFALSPASGAVAADAEWTGTVTRSGGSGKTGTVTLSCSGDNDDKYGFKPSNVINWGTGDGSSSFTFSRKETPSGDKIVVDTLTVSMSASGFSGSTITYGNQKTTVVFKDARVAQTLAEFAAANDGLDGLAADATWYAPSAADGALVCDAVETNGTSELVWTATKGGIAKVSAKDYGTVTAKIGDDAPFELGDEETTIGVAAGDKVVFAAKTPEDAAATPGEMGLKKFSFEELVVTLERPQEGEYFAWPSVCADATLVDLAWSSTSADATYELFGSDPADAIDMGKTVATNGVEAGIVETNKVMGLCRWGVRATDATAEHGLAVAQAVGTFTISAKPEYNGAPTSVSAFLKVGTALDFSAWAPAGTGSITYSASGLPGGLGINAATGLVTGTPSRAGTYTVTVTARNAYGSVTTTFTLNVADFPADLKANYNGVFFDAAQDPAASATWKIAKSGKWSAKLIRNGKTTSASGMVSVDEDGSIKLSGGGFSAVRAAGSSLWTGGWSGLSLYGKKTEKLADSWVGVWNSGVEPSAAPAYAGGVKTKIAKGGKAAFSGKIAVKSKLAGSGLVVVLDGGAVSANLPKWSGNGAVAFVHGWKKTSGKVFDGGFAYCANGKVLGAFTFDGRRYDAVEGAKWNSKQSLASLNGATLTAGAYAVFPVTAEAKKLKAGGNAVSAKVSGSQSAGSFKGSFKSAAGGGKFEGVLYLRGGVLVGVGGGAVSGAPFAVSLEK